VKKAKEDINKEILNLILAMMKAELSKAMKMKNSSLLNQEVLLSRNVVLALRLKLSLNKTSKFVTVGYSVKRSIQKSVQRSSPRTLLDNPKNSD
jgi:hypothetical protein